MENVGIDGGFWKGKRVLITGHTGFKGSWLALWLSHLGARVAGYSLQPPTEPSHYHLLGLDADSVHGDIRDLEHLERFFKGHGPDIVFHLAAQSIVRRSYDDPVETFATNVLGTVNVLQAARTSGTVRAVVNVTSDKCYENREWPWGYREIDPVGGYDPYSASKGCAEIVTGCWRNSFFNPKDYGRTHQTLIASVRAGNVIGGGNGPARPRRDARRRREGKSNHPEPECRKALAACPRPPARIPPPRAKASGGGLYLCRSLEFRACRGRHPDGGGHRPPAQGGLAARGL